MDDQIELRRPTKLTSAIGGAAAAALGLSVAEVVAGTSARLRSPVLDVGDRFIDRVPVWMKDVAIQLFGTNDKIALLVGIAVTLVIYAAILGVLGFRRNMRIAYGGIALFAIVGSLAALGSRSSGSQFAALPALIGSGFAALSFYGLNRLRQLDGVEPSTDTEPNPNGRRRFLTGSVAFLVGAGVVATTGRRLQARFSAAESRAALSLPRPDVTAAAVPEGIQAESAASFFTSNADFYRIDTALSVPQVRAEDWSLKITGLVDRELRLSYRDILNRQLVEHDITLTCVSNTIGGELVGTARWFGIRLDDLLAEAGIDASADQIVGRSVDGYTCGFPVSALDGRDAMIAIGMNGEPLPLEHGFPARLIVPGLYGYVSATKWLSEIELTTFDAFDHYWAPRGYSVEAPIKMQSRIDAPRGLDRIAPGPFAIGGVAWAQTIGIDRVELRIDEGEWFDATLAEELNNTTWRQWSHQWDATPGRHTIEARSTDRNGQVQTDERAEPLPNGASGHHTVVVLVDEA